MTVELRQPGPRQPPIELSERDPFPHVFLDVREPRVLQPALQELHGRIRLHPRLVQWSVQAVGQGRIVRLNTPSVDLEPRIEGACQDHLVGEQGRVADDVVHGFLVVAHHSVHEWRDGERPSGFHIVEHDDPGLVDVQNAVAPVQAQGDEPRQQCRKPPRPSLFLDLFGHGNGAHQKETESLAVTRLAGGRVKNSARMP